MWNLLFGCMFLILNTTICILPVYVLTTRFPKRVSAMVVGVVLGIVASFLFGGTRYVLLPLLWEPPRADSDIWVWFYIIGCFSILFAGAGSMLVLGIVGVVSYLRTASGRCGAGSASHRPDAVETGDTAVRS